MEQKVHSNGRVDTVMGILTSINGIASSEPEIIHNARDFIDFQASRRGPIYSVEARSYSLVGRGDRSLTIRLKACNTDQSSNI